MNNFYQLKLLLWKNFLIKRRLPLILLLETFIPFILFIILGVIRHGNPPLVTLTQNAPAKALPSTGIVTMMQAICSGSPDFPSDDDGLPMLPQNSSLTLWLESLDHVYRNFHVLYPNNSLNIFDKMPSKYEHSIDHLAIMLPLAENLELFNFTDPDFNFTTLFIHYSSAFSEDDLADVLEGDERSNLTQILLQILQNYSDPLDSVNPFLSVMTASRFNGRNYNTKLPRALSRQNNAHLRLFNILQEAYLPDHLLLSSNDSSATSSLLLLSNSSTNSSSSKFQKHLNETSQLLAKDVLRDMFLPGSNYTQINETALKLIRERLSKRLNISDEANRAFDENFQAIQADLIEFTKFHKTLDELANIAVMLPLDECVTNFTSFSANGSSLNETTSLQNSTDSSDYAGFMTIYQAMQPILCPVNASSSSHESYDYSNSSTFYREGGALQYGRDIKQYLPVWIKILRSNPRVLFTPANSSASLVMKKANRTFELIDQLTTFAKHWLGNTSVELHRYFSQPETDQKLKLLKTSQKHLLRILQEKGKHTQVVTNYEKAMQPFFEVDIKNASAIKEQLELIDRAACSWIKLVSNSNLSFFVPFRDENEAIDYSMHKALRDNITVLAVVAFDVNATSGDLMPHTTYRIRMNSSFLPSVRKTRPIYWSPIPRNWDYYYYFSGFSFLQDVIDRAIVDVLVGEEVVEPGTFATNIPMPCYLYDTFLFTNSMILPLCMTISFVYSAAILVQNIVAEKEHRLKEFMKVMGLSNAMHGWAWFITAFIQLTFSMTVVTLILRYSKVLLHSNIVIIWLLLEIYAVATIAFAFLVSSLFSKAKIASATGGMLYFLSYVPAMVIGIREDIAGGDISATHKNLASFLSTSAFGLSCKYISLRESEGAGVQWENIAISPIEHDSFSLIHAFVYLTFDSIIYATLAWYIEQIHPGSYGIPKPWYFPLTKTFWTGLPGDDEYDTPSLFSAIVKCYDKLFRGRRNSDCAILSENDQVPKNTANDDAEGAGKHFERDPTGLLLGVEIDKLSKVYRKTGKVAVNGLSLKLYESQITGLLGHNGAGKTSTMSILTGLLPSSSGAVRVYGLDIAKNLDAVRSSVGFCPQHDVLFEQLTPEEHLQFYSGLKRAASAKTYHAEIEQMLRDVDLVAKRSTPVNHLSGGMKRKLSIALSFIGKSRLVILDEPTAGVDPYSRRAIWDLILKYKSGRTILLSTHHMDEADVLSDRIAIISNGRLKCCGSSIFLRNTFCDGYHLVGVKNARRASSDRAVAFLKQNLPSAYLYSESKQELHFILPYVDQTKFASFFKLLNENVETIGLASYGVFDSTLEEAFLQITRTAQCEESRTFIPTSQHRRQPSNDVQNDMQLRDRPTRGHHGSAENLDTQQPTRRQHTRQPSSDSILLANHTVDKTPLPDPNKPSDVTSVLSATGVITTAGHHRLVEEAMGISSPRNVDMRFIHWKHFRALFIKRLLFVRRNWKVLFSQVFLPAIFVSIAMSMALSAPMFGDPQPLDMSPAQFYNSTKPRGLYTPIANYKTNVQVGNHMAIEADSNELVESLYLVSGLTAKCLIASKSIVNISYETLSAQLSSDCFGTYDSSIPPFTVRSTRNMTGQQFYPDCECAVDFSGLICPATYNRPPTTRLITGDYLVDIGSNSMAEYLLNTADEYRRHRYGAVAFGGQLQHVPQNFGGSSELRRLAVRSVTNYFFEHRGYHALPAYLNAVNNAILRANVKKHPHLGNPAAYGISTFNHPINGTDKIDFQELTVQGTDMMIAIFIIIAMAFVPASFVVFLVYERALLVKHAHIMAGLHPVMYWVSNYVWDILNYFVPAGCCIAVLAIFNVPAYVSGYNLPAIVILFLLYGWSMTPMTYPFSWYFNDPSKAYVILVVFNLFIGTTCLITSFMLDMFHDSPAMKTADDVVKILFLVFPSYCLGRGIMDVAVNHYRNEYFTLSGQYDHIQSPLTWEITLRNYVVMFVEGFLFFGFTILLECISRREFASCKPSNSKKRRSWTPPSVRDAENDDADVVAERHRVMTAATDSDLLVIDGLTKQYSAKTGPLLALDRLSLGMPPGECFGLLGLNGAGKSTTFSMLSGIYSATAGEARLGSQLLCGSDSKPSPNVFRNVGYCPQTDPLIEELTAREHLQLYARIRGICPSQEANVVSWLLERMGLELYADKPSRTFSGGTKRKLSAALALLGDPCVVLLDEPTTGMDPGSRRFLWNLILELRSENRLVVLTSHSMEECEVLCSRLGVMVAGKLRCLGSTQQLKDKFGNGYLITVRLPNRSSLVRNGPGRSSNGSNTGPLLSPTEMLRQAFDKAGIDPSQWRFVAQRHQIVELALLTSKPDLSIIFDMLNGLRYCHLIDDFSVSQNTLDSVFLQLAHGSHQPSSKNAPQSSGSSSTSGSCSNVDPTTVQWGDDEEMIIGANAMLSINDDDTLIVQ